MSRLTRLSVGWLIATLVVLGAVPLVLLTYFSVHLASDAVRDEARARVSSTATVSALAVKSELVGLSDIVESYARRPRLIEAVEHGQRAEIRRQLRELSRTRSGIATAFLARPDGVLVDIVPETPSIIGKSFAFRDWYKGVTRTRRPYVSETYVSQAAGHPRVVAAASLIRSRSRDLGIIVAAYNARFVQGFVERFAATQGVDLIVTDQHGRVVAAPGAPRGVVSRRGDPRVAAALRGRSGRTEANGMLSAYAPVRTLGWTVTADVPTRTALARVDRLRNTVIGIATILGLVLLGGIILLAFALVAQHRSERELRRSREEIAEQNEQLRQVDQMKDEFLSLVTHELRTPLTSIVGYLELLEEDEDDLSEEGRQYLGIVARNARRLQALVGDLLLVARIDAGKLELDRRPVELRELAEHAVDAARPFAASKDVVLELVLRESEVSADGDPERLGQILDNLISNGLKFTPPGGRVEVSVDRNDGVGRIAVCDTGIGMSDVEQRCLFQRFFRAEAAVQNAIPGTGLGLAITKALVEAHGGSIGVTSVEGQGTTFTVELPLLEPALTAAGREAEHAR